MYRTIVSLMGILLSTGSFAAHHEEPEPMVAEVYECTLNDGVTADDVAAMGSSDFADFVAEHDISMTSFLWEAVAVSPQYGDADVRWVNYFPTWADYFAGDAAWRAHGEEARTRRPPPASLAMDSSMRRPRCAPRLRPGGTQTALM